MASWDEMSNTATEWLKPLSEGKWDAPMAVAGSGLGLAGNIGSIFEYLNQKKQYKDYQQKVNALNAAANAPVNWEQFYQPMSTDYQRVMRNAIMAEAASRGLPADSGYATGIMSDSLAAKNNELMTKAMELGNQAKSTQLQGLSSGLQGATSGFAQQPSYATVLASLGKFMDPLAAYRKQQAALTARKSLEGQYGPQQTGQAVSNFYDPVGVGGVSPGAAWNERMPTGPVDFYNYDAVS